MYGHVGVVKTTPIDNISHDNKKINSYGDVIVNKIKQEQKHLNEEEIKRIIDEYKSGKSTYKIAEQFGCHRHTVSDTLKRNGVKITYCKDETLDTKSVLFLYEEKNTLKQIAERYKTTPKVISRCLRKNGVVIRQRGDY